MTKELAGIEEGPKAEIHIDLLKTTLKNIKLENAWPWWNTWFLFQEIPLHSRQNSTRNEKTLTRSTRTRMDDQRKDHIDPKEFEQRHRSKQQQTHNLPTDDVENIKSTSKGRDLLLANKLRIVPWGAERVLKRIQRYSRVTLHRSTHPKWEQVQTEKSSYSPDWLQKGIWYGSAMLDNKLPKNVQNIIWSHKLYRKKHENLESGIDSRRKKLSRSKDPMKRRISTSILLGNWKNYGTRRWRLY